jgi:hypothetical protein
MIQSISDRVKMFHESDTWWLRTPCDDRTHAEMEELDNCSEKSVCPGSLFDTVHLLYSATLNFLMK